ncbi:MAG: dephospho-CoA kinase [Leptotrichiaceae bacterium]|nr:dephospho-CoA kinase [Leptotrichiaceae bacterium]
MVIGLTGGIGTGKSTVVEILKRKGIPVVDADIISREVILYPEVVDRIVSSFGKQVLEDIPSDGYESFKNRKISRNKLGQIVFKDEKKVDILNSIMHPLIVKIMKERIENLKKDYEIVVADVPLLFEINLEKEFDIILLVYSNKNTQVSRIMKRDGRTKEEALNIINSQLDINEKKKKSDYIINNNGSLEELNSEIEKFLKTLQ